MRETEKMKLWLFDLAHGNLSDDRVLSGFVEHYILRDLSISDVRRDIVFHTHYSPEQIQSGMDNLVRVLRQTTKIF